MARKKISAWKKWLIWISLFLFLLCGGLLIASWQQTGFVDFTEGVANSPKVITAEKVLGIGTVISVLSFVAALIGINKERKRKRR